MNINLNALLSIAIITILAMLFTFCWNQRMTLWQSLRKTDTIVFFVVFVALFLLALHYNLLTLSP